MTPAHRATVHNPAAPALALYAVTVTYGSVVALDRVSLTLKRGDHVAVVGPNGAGKSTLFHVIAGVIRAMCRSGRALTPTSPSMWPMW